MKEEDNILKKVGKKNSFKVPEGYFENLTSEVMGKLPEKEGPAFEEVKQPTMWIKKMADLDHETNSRRGR